MTRVLSELLGAKEPAFRLGLMQLERAGGKPNEDIRLSSDIAARVRRALIELGLDPDDTSGRELYGALMNRIQQDEAAIRKLLQISGVSNDISVLIKRFIDKNIEPGKTFALKSSSAKKLLKKYPPKKAMRLIGYRSLDSMLKHEQPALIYAAAQIAETPAWHRQLLAAYKNISARDFEVREVSIFAPQNDKWEKLSDSFVNSTKNNLLAFKELGAIVMLPLTSPPEGAVLACLLLSLHALNDITVTGTYLKLHQVRPDFGELLSHCIRDEPSSRAKMLGESLPWKLVHRFFSHTHNTNNSDLFGPHIHAEDLHWEAAEQTLARLHERFEFWANSAYSGLTDHCEAVSLNFTDAVLNFCNKLPYERRIASYFRDHLRHELMLRYLRQENLEHAVQEQLGNELTRTLLEQVT